MDTQEIKARVQAKVARGEFVFAEDEVRAIAEALDVDVTGTPFGKVAPANSPTRGDVPPFSGTPATPEHAAEGSQEATDKLEEKRTEALIEAKTGRPQVTRESLGADPGLETEVEEHEGARAPNDAQVPSPEGNEGGDGDGVDPDEYTHDELKEMAEDAGVASSGTKADIAERLNANG